jgi:hypothetical protein
MGKLIPQPALLLLDIVDEIAVLSAALTGGYSVDAIEAQVLPAIALDDDVGWIPMVGPTERNFVHLIVSLVALDDPRHSPAPSCLSLGEKPGRACIGGG